MVYYLCVVQIKERIKVESFLMLNWVWVYVGSVSGRVVCGWDIQGVGDRGRTSKVIDIGIGIGLGLGSGLGKG